MSKTHKKFYNINRWEQRFFMNLSPVQKLSLEYVEDKSDNIGVWEPNLKVLQFHVGAELEVESFFKAVNSDNERLIKLPDGNWFIPDYVKFQYCQSNPLNPCNRAHRSYLKDMDSRGLLDWFVVNYPDVMKTSVLYKTELEAEDLDKIPKPFQSFLDTFIKGSNRGLKELKLTRIEKDTDTDKEPATDTEQEPAPNSLSRATEENLINGKPLFDEAEALIRLYPAKGSPSDFDLVTTVEDILKMLKASEVENPVLYLKREIGKLERRPAPDIHAFFEAIKDGKEIPF